MLSEIIYALFIFSIWNKFRLYWNKSHYKLLTKVRSGAEPFFFKKGKTGVLLIHGYTSSAYDTKFLGKYLAKKNISALGVLLKGHGTCPENMTTTNLNDWLRSAEKALLKLRKHCNKVILAGDSFGGNLSLILATKYKVDGIVTMGTPIIGKNKFLTLFQFMLYYPFINFKKKWYHKTLDKKIIEHRSTYKYIPINNLFELAKGIKLSKKAIKKVTYPILIMQSTTDFGVDEKSVDYIFQNVKSKYKKVHWVKNAYHVFIVDRNREKSFKVIFDFVKKISSLKKK